MADHHALLSAILILLTISKLQNAVIADILPPMILPNGPGHEGNDTILTPEQQQLLGKSENHDPEVEDSVPIGLPTQILQQKGPGFEGDDILLTPEQREMKNSRKGFPSSSYYWSEVNGLPQVRYRFNDTLVNQTAVRAAIAHWEANTCIGFLEVSSTFSGSHIYFQRHASACNSYIGMVFPNGQPINVPVWCEQEFGSLVHEIGHAMGFYHEQSRSDRDDYVQINTANILSSAISNFDKATDNNYSVPYDYTSDMHYYERAFESNGHITIATRNPLYQGVIGQRSGLSHMDILLANRMYNCLTKYMANCSISTNPCQNFGFVGRNCQCICPVGTAGTNCETLVKPYNDVKMSNYSQIVSTETTITSPRYPTETIVGEKYTKWIQAPACKLIKLIFNYFNTYQRVNGECLYEGLEIRTTDMFNGTWYCGTEITVGQQIMSSGNQMILFFTTYITGYSAAKWSANVTFVDNPACAANTTTTTTTLAPNTTTTTTTLAPNTTTTTTTLAPNTTTTLAPNTTTTLAPNTTTTTITQAPNTTTTTTTLAPNTTTTTITQAPNTTTTTTTLAPNTTTTTTTSTTTVSGPPVCTTSIVNGRTRFFSPNYPNFYPNNAICDYERYPMNPMKTVLKFLTFQLNAGDRLSIAHPFGPPFVFTGTRASSSTTNIPSQFMATFTSDSALTKKGFAIEVQDSTSACHKLLNPTTPGTVKTPAYPLNKHGAQITCHWRITASPGKQVAVTINMKSVKCGVNYVSVHRSPLSTPFYDPAVVTRFCGSNKVHTAYSNGKVMDVFYWGAQADSGFKMTYTESILS